MGAPRGELGAIEACDTWRVPLPVFVTCRDRLECLQLLVHRLGSLDNVGPIILIDNDSAWPPMVEYLKNTKLEVVRVGQNGGHRALWSFNIHPQLRNEGPFVVTDPDVIPDEDCPPDVLIYLTSLLDRFPEIGKAGLGLRIDDLPQDSASAQDIRDWESQFWETEREPGIFVADIDTTFAVYRAGAGPDHGPAVRTGAPYLARHLPWYTDPGDPGAEEMFYTARARRDSTNWHSRTLQPPLAAALARRRRKLQNLPDHPLLDAWAAEPDLVDETDFTPWARPGWRSWNPMSAELDFCEFVGQVARLLQPGLVVETGIGQGFSTRRISRGQGTGVHLCFESDPELRTALAALPFFLDPEHRLSPEGTPSDKDFALADLTVLDSDPEYRFDELQRWWASARPGSVIVIHDCGNGHPADAIHTHLRRTIESLDIPGTFLCNPRGGFFGVHPGPTGPHRVSQQRDDVQGELDRMHHEVGLLAEELARTRSTLSWRVTKPLRAVQAQRLGRKGKAGTR